MRRRRKASAGAAAPSATSRPRKRRKSAIVEVPATIANEAAEEGESEEDSGEEEEEETPCEGSVGEGALQDVEFDFCDPDEADYHGVSELLRGGAWGALGAGALAELADSIVGQGNVGTLVKSDAGGDDEAVCGILTALNLRQFAHLSWPGAVGRTLLAKAGQHADAGAAEGLRALLERRGDCREVGLLLGERFANLPLELVHPLHQALLDDIEWSCTTPECPADERPFYGFTHFLGVVRRHAAPATAGAGGSAARRGGARRRGRARRERSDGAEAGGAGAAGPPRGGYVRPEDGVLLGRAAFSFAFPAPASAGRSSAEDAEGGGPPEVRVVFGISRAGLAGAVAEMRGALPGAGAGPGG